MNKLKFSAFKAETLDETTKVWNADAKKGLAFPSEVEQILAWTGSHLSHADGDSVAYGVFPDDEKAALGICEIVVSRAGTRNAWVKLLRLRLRPELDVALYNNDNEALATAISVFAVSVAGVLKLKMAHNAPTLKVYARTKDQLTFLQQTALALNKVTKVHKVSIEGRFLVITNKGK